MRLPARSNFDSFTLSLPVGRRQWKRLFRMTRDFYSRRQSLVTFSYVALKPRYNRCPICSPLEATCCQGAIIRHHLSYRTRTFTSTSSSYGKSLKHTTKPPASKIRDYKPSKSKEERLREKAQGSGLEEPVAQVEGDKPAPIGPYSSLDELMRAEITMTKGYYSMVRAENSREYFNARELKEHFDALIRLRARIAAETQTKTYMATESWGKLLSADSVDAFLTEIKNTLAPYLRIQEEEMLKLKQNIQRSSEGLDLGDIAFYSLRLRDSNLAKNVCGTSTPRNLYGYFPTLPTSRKLLAIVGKLSGVAFNEVLPTDKDYENILQHYKDRLSDHTKRPERPLIFTASNAKNFWPAPGKDLGSLVLDIIHADGKEQSAHCGSFGMYCKEVDSNGKRIALPGTHVAIAANFSKASLNMPLLVGPVEIKTLAHELGHAIHRLVRQGTHDCPRDSIEIPSIVMEKLAIVPEILHELSSPHYIYQRPSYMTQWQLLYPDEPLPPKWSSLETFSSVKLRNHPRNRLFTFQMIFWRAKFDLVAHSLTQKQTEAMDLAYECQKIFNEIFYSTDRLNSGEGRDNTYLSWKSLENYETSYYCYLVAEVYATDIWTKAFATDPLNEKEGRRFRRIVLEHRDDPPIVLNEWEFIKDPLGYPIRLLIRWMKRRPETMMGALEEFMGRKLNSKAFNDALKAPRTK
ncbi:hypothetical protein VTL71DRAFT_10292 [Oculimacula yallundae]|uniref:Peptidase M3A/M3B catalytic domain-containing protein n=1 Tax=Oculimacula yallundae TaxID=86028 RepID=A0ABR4CUB9_9HELO